MAPEVTVPTGCAVVQDGHALAGGAGAFDEEADEFLFGAFGVDLADGSAPMKSLLRSTAQARPAERGSMFSVSSWP